MHIIKTPTGILRDFENDEKQFRTEALALIYCKLEGILSFEIENTSY